MTNNWKELSEKKKKELEEAIPAKWRLDKIVPPEEISDACAYLDEILPESEVKITSMTLRELADKIAKGQLTSVEVTEAFCHRAAYSQQLLNCCTEIFFDKALKAAQKCDDYYKEHGKVMGPFHGLPFTVKDQVNLPGMDSSIGYCAYLFKPRPLEDMSLIAMIMGKLGAIFYVKTTVPMAMLAYDTYSNAFGYTMNSRNRKLSAGGSSGGEGAMIGSRGALLGLGTDIGGSIRVPSAFNLIYGLRPSHGRIPYLNVFNSYSGQPVIPSVIGPMAQDLDDLEWYTEQIVGSEPWLQDPKVLPIPWRKFKVETSDRFNFGIMEWDEVTPVDPPISRGIKTVRDALAKAGHDCIDWEPQGHAEIQSTALDILAADLGKEVKDVCALTGEKLTVPGLTTPSYPEIRTVNEHWDDADRKYVLQKKYLDYWNSTKEKTKNGKPVDAWISPVWHSAAFKYYDTKIPSYTVTLNLLDYSVVIVPVTRASKELDPKPEGYEGEYDPELFDGAPVAVQVITRRLEEEKAVALARVLRDALAA